MDRLGRVLELQERPTQLLFGGALGIQNTPDAVFDLLPDLPRDVRDAFSTNHENSEAHHATPEPQ
jgi:hypothetical protein